MQQLASANDSFPPPWVQGCNFRPCLGRPSFPGSWHRAGLPTPPGFLASCCSPDIRVHAAHGVSKSMALCTLLFVLFFLGGLWPHIDTDHRRCTPPQCSRSGPLHSVGHHQAAFSSSVSPAQSWAVRFGIVASCGVRHANRRETGVHAYSGSACQYSDACRLHQQNLTQCAGPQQTRL